MDIIEEAVSMFNGTSRWLTLFGNRYVHGFKDLGEIKNYAIKIALNELKHLVRERGSKRYAYVLKAISLCANSWSKVKNFVENIEKSTVSKGILSRVIKSLEKLSIIRNYEFLDPIYREAARRLI